MTTDTLWHAVTARDRAADGLFVYAVQSTHIYCRPSCPSRRPRRDRVEFFPTTGTAEASGYRACKRCRPTEAISDATADARVRRACDAIARRPDSAWTSAAIARAGGTSVVQVQRAFRTVLGISPRDYVMACRRRRFLDGLRAGHDVTRAVYDAGYGSSSRAYEESRLPGMTPATYGRGGAGATIAWQVIASSLGRILVAATTRGLCFVEIGATTDALVARLRREFPNAEIASRASSSCKPFAEAAKAVAEAGPVAGQINVDIRGTAFQWRVWRALTRIPRGETRTYADVARAIGQPTSARAVARACATNPIALVVPCHRVVPATGEGGGYRWGAAVKVRLLQKEGRPSGRLMVASSPKP